MASNRNSFVANVIFLVGILTVISNGAEATRPTLHSAGPVFDVTKFGAKPGVKGNGNEDENLNGMAITRAWRAACGVKGGATVLIPKGEFVAGEVFFSGPCGGKITVNIEGNLKAPASSSEFPNEGWFNVMTVDGLLITGTGSVDGLGQDSWKANDCSTNLNCVLAVPNIMLYNATNVVVQGITSINSKAYHILVHECNQVTVSGVKVLTKGGLRPNTDGVHIISSSFVNVVKNYIESGEDCVSVGYGSSNINVDGVTCKGGDGISIGVSAGRGDDMERNIRGVIVKGTQLTDTKHGFKIKTGRTAVPMEISGININGAQMTNVQNPISIDQMFGGALSNVKLNKVAFENIRGTTPSKEVANLACSKLAPCGVSLKNVNLISPATRKPVASAVCTNVLGAAFCRH